MSYCENCGEPLSEFEMCSYGDLCIFCHEKDPKRGVVRKKYRDMGDLF